VSDWPTAVRLRIQGYGRLLVVAGAWPLLETDALHTSGGFGGNISEQTLSSLRGLRGIHVSSAQEPMFDSAEVQLEYLLGWVGRFLSRVGTGRRARG
jgi:hypothetical protein